MPTIGNYKVTYSCRDFGTERVLTVQDHLDRIIGQRDPFWPGGIPADPAKRKARLAAVAREIIDDHERLVRS